MDHQNVKAQIDFLQCLETDVTLHIMSFLNDAADIVRAGAVSRTWRQFVVTHGLAKQLCLKAFPQLSDVGLVNVNSRTRNPVLVETNAEKDWQTLLRDQEVYASLLHALTKSRIPPKDCIMTAVSASSTDHFPDESIVNTLSSRDRYMNRALYWSSTGQTDPVVPETLIYKLRPGFWVINEINIQPFQAFFQPENPIYSAKSVRFRLGHPKPDIKDDFQRLPMLNPADDKFVWTYTSPEFPMVQENCLQPFQLPEPLLCINGFLQIELLGRVQKQEIDGLFYFCMCYVQAMGRPLFPAFEIEIPKPNGKKILKYNLECLRTVLESTPYTIRVPQVQSPPRQRTLLGLIGNDMRQAEDLYAPDPRNIFPWDLDNIMAGNGADDDDDIILI